jgi:hypothetical protein
LRADRAADEEHGDEGAGEAGAGGAVELVGLRISCRLCRARLRPKRKV